MPRDPSDSADVSSKIDTIFSEANVLLVVDFHIDFLPPIFQQQIINPLLACS